VCGGGCLVGVGPRPPQPPTTPHPQPPNPQSPIPNPQEKIIEKIKLYFFNKVNNNLKIIKFL